MTARSAVAAEHADSPTSIQDPFARLGWPRPRPGAGSRQQRPERGWPCHQNDSTPSLSRPTAVLRPSRTPPQSLTNTAESPTRRGPWCPTADNLLRRCTPSVEGVAAVQAELPAAVGALTAVRAREAGHRPREALVRGARAGTHACPQRRLDARDRPSDWSRRCSEPLRTPGRQRHGGRPTRNCHAPFDPFAASENASRSAESPAFWRLEAFRWRPGRVRRDSAAGRRTFRGALRLPRRAVTDRTVAASASGRPASKRGRSARAQASRPERASRCWPV